MGLIDADAAMKMLGGEAIAKYPNTFTMGLLAAVKEIDNMPTIEQPQWISCAERLPDENQEVLCLTPDGSFRVFGWTYIDWMWFDDNEWRDEKDVTHWMPLPEPPKEH